MHLSTIKNKQTKIHDRIRLIKASYSMLWLVSIACILFFLTASYLICFLSCYTVPVCTFVSIDAHIVGCIPHMKVKIVSFGDHVTLLNNIQSKSIFLQIFNFIIRIKYVTYMCICICTHICICVYVYVCIHIHIYVSLSIYLLIDNWADSSSFL